MCAAPGSKTAQLIEMVSAPVENNDIGMGNGDNNGNRDGNSGDSGVGGGIEGEVGLVVANDSDRDRAYMLAHQCKRVKSPAICITWCDAQILPNLGAANAKRGDDKGGWVGEWVKGFRTTVGGGRGGEGRGV